MTKIKAIGFDWGGVLFVYPDGPVQPAAAAFLDVPLDDFRQVYFQHNHMVNKGPDVQTYEEAEEMWSKVLTQLGRGERLADFMKLLQSRKPGQYDQKMLELVRRLKKDGWKLGLLSNNSPAGAQEARKIDLSELFDVVLFSAEIDAMKPEPKAFTILADRLGVSLDELVFIDDAERSLSTSAELGYEPILFKSFEQLVKKFIELGILTNSNL